MVSLQMISLNMLAALHSFYSLPSAMAAMISSEFPSEFFSFDVHSDQYSHLVTHFFDVVSPSLEQSPVCSCCGFSKNNK